MLTLFYKPTCPFCRRVLDEAEDSGIEIELKDVSNNAEALEELIQKGGKKQTPFLEDQERGVSMYESGDIISYLTEHYKKEAGLDDVS